MLSADIHLRTGNSVSGRLEAEAVSHAGQTRLRNLYHSVPFHISKPYWDGKVLLLQVASPTAGVFSGDRLSSRIRVSEGASLLCTNQGASRIHPTMGRDAVLDQEFEVSSGAWLELFPELLIPHKGAALTQKTVVNIEPGARVYLGEMLAPGRTASGEVYAYSRLDWKFRLNLGGRPLVIERAEITAKTIPWMFVRPPGWDQIYYGCLWVVAPEVCVLEEGDFEEIENLSTEKCLIGVTQIAAGAIALKLVAESSIPLRNSYRAIRQFMARRLPGLSQLESDPRKL